MTCLPGFEFSHDIVNYGSTHICQDYLIVNVCYQQSFVSPVLLPPRIYWYSMDPQNNQKQL